MSTFYMPGLMPSTSTLNVLFYLTFTTTLWGKYSFPHFRNEESEAYLSFFFIKNLDYIFNKNMYSFILWLIVNLRSFS